METTTATRATDPTTQASPTSPSDVTLVVDPAEIPAPLAAELGVTTFLKGGGATVLAYREGDDWLGGWLFERWTGPGGSVTLHWAGLRRGWLRRFMLSQVAVYAFHQLQVWRVIGEVRASATAIRRIDEKLGFVEVTTIPGYYPDDDLVIYEMTRDRCRFLPPFLQEDSSYGQA